MHQPERNGRSALINPKVKNEDEEISALGGMTRLVSRRSATSPSINTPSPTSHHSSPSIPEYVYPPLPEPSTTSSSWQNYTHIENLNVSINMGVSDFYSTNFGMSSPTTTATALDDVNLPADGMDLVYHMPALPSQHPHQNHSKQIQQPFHHPISYSQQQQINSQDIVTGMGINAGLPPSAHDAYYMPGYGVGNSSYGPIYGEHLPLHSPSDTQSSIPPQNLRDSWQNFMAQYKP